MRHFITAVLHHFNAANLNAVWPMSSDEFAELRTLECILFV